MDKYFKLVDAKHQEELLTLGGYDSPKSEEYTMVQIMVFECDGEKYCFCPWYVSSGELWDYSLSFSELIKFNEIVKGSKITKKDNWEEILWELLIKFDSKQYTMVN